MARLVFAAALLLFAAAPAHAQYLQPPVDALPLPYFELPELSEGEAEDEIETDRDSFTPAATVAGCQRLIVESAWSFIDNRAVPDTNSLPELVLRYGVSDWLELRLGWNWEAGGAANAISGGGSDQQFEDEAEIERDSQIAYGLKAALTDQAGWWPESSFILIGATPTYGRDTATSLVATYVAGWELPIATPKRWKWDSALRYSYDSSEGDHFNLWAPSTVLKLPLGERWTTHAEYFGVFSHGRERVRSQHYFSPGVHCLLTSDFEIGIRVGWGLNDQAANFFANTGVGWRY
jgi:hypothetical protein